MPHNSALRKFYHSRLFTVVMAIIAVFLIVAYARGYYQEYQVRREISRLKDQVKQLETKKLQTLEALQYAKSDQFVEEKARKELNMIKDGEQMAIIAGNGRADFVGQENSDVVKLAEPSNPLKWWRYFFN